MTYEKISKKYPIGKVLATTTEPIHDELVWYNERDLEVYRRKYDKVVVNSDNTCSCYGTHVYIDRVEGWLYDGEEWTVVENTWDGWVPVDVEKYYEKEND